MTKNVGARRKTSELIDAQNELSYLYEKYSSCNFTNNYGYALYSAIQVARKIVESALLRKESLGAHYIQK